MEAQPLTPDEDARRATMLRLEARSFANTLDTRAAQFQQRHPEVAGELRKAALWIRRLSDNPKPAERGNASPPTVAVAGRMELTLDTFERRCLTEIEHMQTRISPDNALLALLCDAVRMKREYVEALAGGTR